MTAHRPVAPARRAGRWVWALVLWALLCLACLPAAAQSLESVLSPGAVIKGHAKTEDDCKACHTRFDRAAQDGLCVACHKEVGQDVKARTGFHGRQKAQPCRNCHTDHKGRDMRIVDFTPKEFDHRQSDYLLRGKHVEVPCAQCHKPTQKYRQAPSDCLSCHRKDDKHKGNLGAKCADCHTEKNWTEAKFDHGTTQFALTGKHIDAKCADCHKSADYKAAPSTCIGCHKKVDKHKARFGEKCESCHSTKNWTGISFRHDTDTKYILRGKHRTARCESCHTGPLYRDKLGSACLDCHKKDDKHNASLGPDCGACHTEKNWKETARFDHDRSSFPLRGAHVKPECSACHTSVRYKEAPSDCFSCHKKDDKHEATLGKDCAACHTDVDWKATRFSHTRTRFQLRAGHSVPPLKCSACHVDQKTYRQAPMDCLSCHRKDDKHEGQLGVRCESCHTETSWTKARFNHATARFALTGSHVNVKCTDCHKTLRYKDAPRDCLSCHGKDDKHKVRFGTACESCHNARSWAVWQFDHQRQTDYPLASGHLSVACEACHRAAAPAGKLAAPLQRSCVSCHERDDTHAGNLGPRCEQCHSATRWNQVSNRVRTGAAPAPSSAPGAPAGASRSPSKGNPA